MENSPTLPFSRISQLIDRTDGFLSRHEQVFLYACARLKGRNVLVEIGSFHGKSTLCLAAGSDENSVIHAVDPHNGAITVSGQRVVPSLTEIMKTLRRAGLVKKVEIIIATSKKAARRWEKQIDVLFIDGLHDYHHAREDYLQWNRYVRDGGIIAFHEGYCGIGGVVTAAMKATSDKRVFSCGACGSILYIVVGKPRRITDVLMLSLRRALLKTGQWIWKSSGLPYPIRFFICHRLIKFLLVGKIERAMKKYSA